MSEFIGLRWNYWNLSKHKDFKLIYSFCKENLNLKPKVKTFYLVLLYELIYEIWIMQFVLLSRLKPDLCKSPGKLLKDFVVHPVDKCLYPRQSFVCIIQDIFFGDTFLHFFVYLCHLFCIFLHFRGKHLLVKTLRH